MVEKHDPMRDFLANFGFARNPSGFGIVEAMAGVPTQGIRGVGGPVGSLGLPTSEMQDPAALATRAVAGAYDAALDYLARAEAETGERVGPLRTAAPVPTANILRGMR